MHPKSANQQDALDSSSLDMMMCPPAILNVWKPFFLYWVYKAMIFKNFPQKSTTKK